MLGVLQGKIAVTDLTRLLKRPEELDLPVDAITDGGLRRRNKAMAILAEQRGIPRRAISRFLPISPLTVAAYGRAYSIYGRERLIGGSSGGTGSPTTSSCRILSSPSSTRRRRRRAGLTGPPGSWPTSGGCWPTLASHTASIGSSAQAFVPRLCRRLVGLHVILRETRSASMAVDGSAPIIRWCPVAVEWDSTDG
jgi:hypothetical protein